MNVSQSLSRQFEWRVVSFFGSIHMSTVIARDEDDARAIHETARGTPYTTWIDRREVGPWERV